MLKKRIDEIDIIKALGIICMVAGHAGAPFTKFIYLFHMAIFFIASGFFYKEQSSDSIKNVFNSILKKMKQLWLPYFVWNTIFVLLNNVFIKINVYTDNPDILNYVQGEYIGTHDYLSIVEMIKLIVKGAIFFGGTEMGGALWFLKILFMVSVFYCISDFFIKKMFKKHILVIQIIVSMVLLMFGYWCSLKQIYGYGIERTASFYVLYLLGHILSLYKEKYIHWNWKCHLPILVVSFALLLILNNFGNIALNSNSYENPLFLLATSFLGWCLLYSISYFIKLLPHIKFIFVEIGKRTLSVVIFHFLSLKIVAGIIVLIYNLPSFCIAAFPNLYGYEGLWWIAYTIVGVGVPVLLNIIYHKLISLVKNRILALHRK